MSTKPANTKPKMTNTKPPRAPSKEERDERRKKGLCMWCGVKYSFNHQCLRSQLYRLLMEEEDGSSIGFEDVVDYKKTGDTVPDKLNADGLNPMISLHAFLGTGDS